MNGLMKIIADNKTQPFTQSATMNLLKSKKQPLEKDIQKSIIEYLELLEAQGKLYFIRSNSGAIKTQRPDGSTGYMKTGKAGCPDIIVCSKHGQFVGVEVKTEKGKLSPAQELTSQLIDKLGAIYIVARSVKELDKDFKSLELI